MKLTELIYNMLQEVIVTPQAEHYPKFRYYITNILESIHSEKEMSNAMVCDSCLLIKNVFYTICVKCGKPMDVCEECMKKSRTAFSNNCTCSTCKVLKIK